MLSMKPLFVFVIAFVYAMTSVAQSTPTADAILKEACTKAAKENKNVMVIFHASWCGWCHKMDTSLNDASVKTFFDRNYVITHLTVSESDNKKNLENPGAEILFDSLAGKNSGIPFWFIMNKDGKILADSQT